MVVTALPLDELRLILFTRGRETRGRPPTCFATNTIEPLGPQREVQRDDARTLNITRALTTAGRHRDAHRAAYRACPLRGDRGPRHDEPLPLAASEWTVSPAPWPWRLPVRLARVEAQRESVERISAVTLLTVNMVEAVPFYQALGFHLLYGGPEAPFTSFRSASATSTFSSTQSALPEGQSGVESCSGSTTWTRCTDGLSRRGSIRKPHPRTQLGASGTSTSTTETATS